MRAIILLLLILPFAAAVDFYIDAPTDARQGSTITAYLIMDNTQPVYGYEATVTSDAAYQTHDFTSRLNGGINTFTQLNSTTVRAATVKPTGISAGNTSIMELNYTLLTAGTNKFNIQAKSYDQNGSAQTTTTQDFTMNVTGNILKTVSHTTDQRKTTLSICTQTEALNELKFTLEYSGMTISSSSAGYDPIPGGANITVMNVPAHATCQEAATIDFDVLEKPGTNIPLTIESVTTTPDTILTTQDGSIQYNGYRILCDNITAYRNITAEMPIELDSHTSLQSLNFTMDTVFNITNASKGNLTGTELDMDSPGNVDIYMEIPSSYTNGQYTFTLKDILAATSAEVILHENEPECTITIADHCIDQDGDGFFYGTECGNITQDCDDKKAGVNPNATETCNGRDDDCDGRTDEGVCATSSGGGGGGGGGGSSASSAGTASAGTSGGFASFPIPEDTAVPIPDTPPKKKEQPLQTKLPEPEKQPEKAAETKPEPKKINLIAHVMGVLTLLGAGLLIVYEYLKHRHPH